MTHALQADDARDVDVCLFEACLNKNVLLMYSYSIRAYPRPSILFVPFLSSSGCLLLMVGRIECVAVTLLARPARQKVAKRAASDALTHLASNTTTGAPGAFSLSFRPVARLTSAKHF